MKKIVLPLIVLICFTILTACAATSKTQADASPLDAKDLIGRWEGTVSISGPTMSFNAENTSYFALEIFAIEGTDKKRVFYRGICPMCLTQQWYSDKGVFIDKKGKIGLEIPERFEFRVYKRGNPPSDGFITTKSAIFMLKGDKLSGYAAGFFESSSADFILRKTPYVQHFIPQKDLIGRWVREARETQEELLISEIDEKSKTFKGKYKIGNNEYELTEASFDEDRLSIDFKASNNHLYQLRYYPNLSEYPPALWGSVKAEGKVSYTMFRRVTEIK